MKTFAFSDKGPRPENQDAFLVRPIGDGLIAAVADGVGGNNGGQLASKLAIKILEHDLLAGGDLAACFRRIHEDIRKTAEGSAVLQGMATTLTAIKWDSRIIRGVHCGDSRAYLLRGNGIKQLTVDHTELARLLAEGRISKEDAKDYPRKNVLTTALGTHKILETQSFEFATLPRDRLLLLTDGIYSGAFKQEIQVLSSRSLLLSDFCEDIISLVNSRSPTDNFTILGIEMD